MLKILYDTKWMYVFKWIASVDNCLYLSFCFFSTANICQLCSYLPCLIQVQCTLLLLTRSLLGRCCTTVLITTKRLVIRWCVCMMQRWYGLYRHVTPGTEGVFGESLYGSSFLSDDYQLLQTITDAPSSPDCMFWLHDDAGWGWAWQLPL